MICWLIDLTEHCFFAGAESVYTVEEAVEKLGFGIFQILVTVFSGLLWVCSTCTYTVRL